MSETGSHQTDIINQYHEENKVLRARVAELDAEVVKWKNREEAVGKHWHDCEWKIAELESRAEAAEARVKELEAELRKKP